MRYQAPTASRLWCEFRHVYAATISIFVRWELMTLNRYSELNSGRKTLIHYGKSSSTMANIHHPDSFPSRGDYDAPHMSSVTPADQRDGHGR